MDDLPSCLTARVSRSRARRTGWATSPPLVAAGCGVIVLPDWVLPDRLVREGGADLPIRPGPTGLPKSIHLGTRRGEEAVDYIAGFLELARETGRQGEWSVT